MLWLLPFVSLRAKRGNLHATKPRSSGIASSLELLAMTEGQLITNALNEYTNIDPAVRKDV